MPELPAIPQASPGRGYEQHRAEYDEAVARALQSGHYILGPEVDAFESEFAAYVGVDHAIGVGSGTDAIELALRGLGVGAGDAVFTVSHTAVATVVAIERTGASPVLLDVDDDFTMDPIALRRALGTRLPGGMTPRAVVVVHLYGRPADMPAILKIATAHGLVVVEDCAQAHGAAIGGTPVGRWGNAAAFSFYPTKNLAAFGDGGAVVTGDVAVAGRVRELRQYGWRDRYVSADHGINSRLDEVQAAVLRVGLRHLEEQNDGRRSIAAAYDSGLAGAGIALPSERPGTRHVYHQYVVRSRERGRLRQALTTLGIGTAIHYPVPVHLQPAYVRSARGSGLDNTERIATEILSLPMFPGLTEGEVARVIDALAQTAVAG